MDREGIIEAILDSDELVIMDIARLITDYMYRERLYYRNSGINKKLLISKYIVVIKGTKFFRDLIKTSDFYFRHLERPHIDIFFKYYNIYGVTCEAKLLHNNTCQTKITFKQKYSGETITGVIDIF